MPTCTPDEIRSMIEARGWEFDTTTIDQVLATTEGVLDLIRETLHLEELGIDLSRLIFWRLNATNPHMSIRVRVRFRDEVRWLGRIDVTRCGETGSMAPLLYVWKVGGEWEGATPSGAYEPSLEQVLVDLLLNHRSNKAWWETALANRRLRPNPPVRPRDRQAEPEEAPPPEEPEPKSIYEHILED